MVWCGGQSERSRDLISSSRVCAGLAAADDDDAAAVSVCKPRSGGGEGGRYTAISDLGVQDGERERERDVKVKGYGCGTGRYERHLSQSIVSSLVSFFTFYGSCWLSAFHFVLASRLFCKLVDGILLIKYISVQYSRKRPLSRYYYIPV